MEVQVNNNPHIIDNGASIAKLLLELGFDKPQGIAIAINNQVVPKTEWQNHFLQPSDKITIITATQGG